MSSRRTTKRQLEENECEDNPNQKRKRDESKECGGVVESDSSSVIGEDELTEASKNEVTQLSDSVFVYQNRKISDHGNVFEGEIRSGVYGVRVCVMKFSRKSEQNVNEARILTRLSSHTHVISIIESGFYKDLFDERVYIALEKCYKHNLRQHLIERKESSLNFNLTEALEYCKQIIAGVTYIHDNLIIHKDLKPSNILLTQDKSNIKIADFGLSQEIKSTSSKVYCRHQFGTNGFRPIESFGKDWVSLKSDSYSLGAVLYFILSNCNSPLGDENTLWTHNTINGLIDLSQLLVPNAAEFRHLIKLMLSKDRCRRPSISQVADHPCWTGKETECDFDYGCEEEFEDSKEEVSKIDDTPSRKTTGASFKSKDEDNIKKEYESYHQFFDSMKKMGYRVSTDTSIVVFVSRPMHLERFNPKTKSLTRMQEFNYEMKESYNFSAISFRGFIFVFTRRSTHKLNYIDCTATWQRMADLVEDHGDKPPAVASSGAIFIAGSCNGEETDSVTKYDIKLNRWEKCKHKQLATSWATLVALNGYIYSIGGGAEGIGMTNRVERLNVASNVWDEIAPMTEERYGATSVEFQTKIIVAGGMDPRFEILSSVETYDTGLNQWTFLKSMLEGRRWFRCHSIDGNIYAVFGSETKCSIEKYDSKNDTWEFVEFPKLEEVLARESIAI